MVVARGCDPERAGLVRMVMEEMGHRTRAVETVVSVSRRLQQHTEVVLAFATTINSGLFDFIHLLDEHLRGARQGRASLLMNNEQADLTRHVLSSQDWRVKHFPFVKADLEVDLSYVADGKEVWAQTHSGTVLFLPHKGVIEWADGTCEIFRSHRENARGDDRFGDLELLDLISMIGIPARSGRPDGGDLVLDDPEMLIVRKICDDRRWPGWREC